jgi:hypothetical protein
MSMFEAAVTLSPGTPLLEAPIFIVGLNKSGTSLLYLLLSQHEQLSPIKAFKTFKGKRPGTAMLPMERYGIGEGQKIPDLPDKLHGMPEGSGRWALPQFIKRYRLTEADVEAEDAERVARAYRQSMVEPSARLCEKTPPNLLRTRYLQALYPDAVFVAIVRDPYANVSANGKKRTKWGNVEDQALHWSEAYAVFLEDRKHLHRSLLIRYETLVESRADVLRLVCEFCGLPGVISPPDDLTIERNVNDELIDLLSDEETSAITRICEPTMRAFDYPVRARGT